MAGGCLPRPVSGAAYVDHACCANLGLAPVGRRLICVGRVGETADMPDDAVLLEMHLAFLSADRGDERRSAAGDRARRVVAALSDAPS